MSKLVLASSNQGKLAELNRQLEHRGITVISQGELNIPDAVEDGLSFVENAIKKARHAAKLSGLPALADDSGIAVDALGGKPGIYSARYADNQGDEANNRKLLLAMADKTQRSARFHCCLVLMRHAEDPTPVICNGVWEGRILTAPQGRNGFGYDPVFLPSGSDRAAAEYSSEEKMTTSHRAQALALLNDFLNTHPEWLTGG
ncbi:RdgB/HAM1 family non-canonical purine NTP pyrophosphatase [uncultured Umboniibacter sp.]|uniref:RdgB/HAM1 family non-canonical purine NTP pyrophosphatase n=1 Tax=uncultured Umboniibacter sp. TaxID=1798917 RepID=UPI0026265018|nr:RdgB/HAM1 family non-canonical purine NTP pyrophosphatase [uncultured Umboniibacter sp.]